ncbi:MAG: hypothetical protein Q9208_004979 [Pyrenodesmia sp. 3 TL-2023]
MSDPAKTSSGYAVDGGSHTDRAPNGDRKDKPSQTFGPPNGREDQSTMDGHSTQPDANPPGERQRNSTSVSPMLARWKAEDGREEPWNTVAILNAPSSLRDPVQAEGAPPSRRAKTV